MSLFGSIIDIAAPIVGEILGGPPGAAIGGALGGSMAAGQAASKQAAASGQAAAASLGFQQNAFNTIQGNLQPYNQAGQQALGQWQGMLGIGPNKVDPNQVLKNTPGYQFQLSQGINALQNSQLARGMGLSGNTLQGVQQFGQGLADQTFNQYLQQLAGLTGIGQSSAAGAANMGGNVLSSMGQTAAGGILGAGNAQAAGTIGAYNAGIAPINSMLNNYAGQQALSNMFVNSTNPGVSQAIGSTGFPTDASGQLVYD